MTGNHNQEVIVIGADHAGFALKEKVKEWLGEWGYACEDVGNHTYDKGDDFPDFAFRVAQRVSAEGGRGIVMCGSGAGVSMTANKVRGIRAAILFSPEQAEAATRDDAVKVAVLSARFVPEAVNREIVKVWLATPFEADVPRRVRRMKKIEDIEKKTFR